MDQVTATVLGVIGAVLTVLSVSVAFFSFYFNRKKNTEEDGEFKGVMKQDMAYIKKGVDELKSANTRIENDIRDIDRRVTLVEASAKSAHHRIDTIERKEEAHG